MAAKRLMASVTVVSFKPATLAEEANLIDRVADLADAHGTKYANVVLTEEGDTLTYDWLIRV